MMQARALTAIAAALTALALVPAGASAYTPAGPDFQITGGDQTRDPFTEAVAHNPELNQYLVTWAEGRNPEGDQYEIYGQLLSATGAKLGARFQISNVTDIDLMRDADSPAVTYNSTEDEYLVVFDADRQADGEQEIHGQRVTAAGVPTGTDDFRISEVYDAGGAARGGATAKVAWNATDNQYLVTFNADGIAATDNKFEVWGQRLTGTGGDLGGDFRISETGMDADATRWGLQGEVAWNSTANNFLVTWFSDESADQDFEVSGQIAGANGSTVVDDFVISEMTGAAFGAELAYNPNSNQYLVTWTSFFSNDDVYGQIVGAAGSEVLDDFQISNVGAPTRRAGNHDVEFSSANNSYLVTFLNGPTADFVEDVWAQELAASGAEQGAEFQVTNVGLVGADRDAYRHDLAFNSVSNEFLTIYESDMLTDGFTEIFGCRLIAGSPGTPCRPGLLPPETPPTTTPPAGPTGQRAAALKKCAKIKNKKKKKKCKKRARRLPV